MVGDEFLEVTVSWQSQAAHLLPKSKGFPSDRFGQFMIPAT